MKHVPQLTTVVAMAKSTTGTELKLLESFSRTYTILIPTDHMLCTSLDTKLDVSQVFEFGLL
jgi:hypothetical protein